MLQAEPRKYSIYREEAVDAIIIALECSATNEKVREQSCRSLYILGGHFSYSGDTLTAAWLLKEAGFCDGSEANSFNNDDEEMPTVHSVYQCIFMFLILFSHQLEQLMLLPELLQACKRGRGLRIGSPSSSSTAS